LLDSSDAPSDWPKVWALLEPVFRDGETFSHDPAITEDVALAACIKSLQKNQPTGQFSTAMS